MDGSRNWLLDCFRIWLVPDPSLSPTLKHAPWGNSRAFLLLSGPGTGKSTFSAVLCSRISLYSPSSHQCMLVSSLSLFALKAFFELSENFQQIKHFFRRGDKSAQGRSMILSLAYQAAQKLPGVATFLNSVIAKHDGKARNALSLEELFNE
jgi:hypothetical protein